jgi:tRNA nucleotidyltransferase (CCA-adding enzyme)
VSVAGIDPAADGAALLECLRAQPGGAALLELAHGRDDLELVGGAVRDLLLGRTPRELDVVVAADAPALAQTVARELGAEATVHERFGTALVEHGEARLDFATRRAEFYPAPGALPVVRVGTSAEDLLRRDFTVNAIAVALGGDDPGRLRTAPDALEDLRAGCLRVLHDASFRDDPTRLLRLARYRVRLGFTVEERTEALAREAIGAGALATLSGARVGAELRLALGEPDPLAALAALEELGVLRALHPRLRLERGLVRGALDLLAPAGGGGVDASSSAQGEANVLLLSALTLPLALRAEGDPGAEIRALLDRLEFPGAERDLTLAAATAVPRLLQELPRRRRASELYALAAPVPPEAVALAGALDAAHAAEAARRWLHELRNVRLGITGADLLAAGVPEGPEIGRRLRATLMLRLDGEVDLGRTAELRAALEMA